MTNRIPFIDSGWDFWADYDKGVWEPETKAVLERFLGPDTRFLDIGAWIGPVTLWAVELGATVHAIEPDPVAFGQLVQNTVGMPVNCVRAAVGAQRGTVALGSPRSFFGDSQSRLGTFDETIPTVDVEVIDVMDATQGRHWDLIKVDIEGGEVDVLPTLAPMAADVGAPLYVSWHEEWFSHPVSLDQRQSWFSDFSTLEPIRGDGWIGWSELLAIP